MSFTDLTMLSLLVSHVVLCFLLVRTNKRTQKRSVSVPVMRPPVRPALGKKKAIINDDMAQWRKENDA